MNEDNVEAVYRKQPTKDAPILVIHPRRMIYGPNPPEEAFGEHRETVRKRQ